MVVPPAAEVQACESQDAAGNWALILGVGGACWCALAALARLPGAPASVPLPPGPYLAQQLLVFLAAAGAWRVTLALAWPQRPTARIARVGLALLIALAVTVLAPQLADSLIGLPSEYPWRPLTALAAHWGAAAQRFLPPYLLGLCATLLAVSAREASRARRQAAALAAECAGAHMRMLSSQLQPHFLFNALHAISVLVDDSPRRAAAMIARLGDFLRHALEGGRWPWTDLASELAGVEAYLAVQQMRFADTLSVCVQVTADALAASVPALLLQPLIENAIEHGRSAQGARLHVQVEACVAGTRLRILIGNSHSHLRSQLTPVDFGHGLANVEQRLHAAYGEDAQLRVAPDGKGGTAAVLDLPRRTFRPARPAARQSP